MKEKIMNFNGLPIAGRSNPAAKEIATYGQKFGVPFSHLVWLSEEKLDDMMADLFGYAAEYEVVIQLAGLRLAYRGGDLDQALATYQAAVEFFIIKAEEDRLDREWARRHN